MTGHAILNSCHNCGKKNCRLQLVSPLPDGSKGNMSSDGHCPDMDPHVHVFVACDECREGIWEAKK